MFEGLVQLIILFAVIFDPLASFFVFFSASKQMTAKERKATAILAILVAFGLSLSVILLGVRLLTLFDTTIEEFKIAGGIILAVLGVKMALGIPLTSQKLEKNKGRAIASIIGTPLLTGPAAITAIIISVDSYGILLTTSAIIIVLGLTTIIFLQTEMINKIFGETMIQVMSTVFGMITLSWGVKLIKEGIVSLFPLIVR